MQGDSAAGSLNGFFGKNGITPEEIVLVTVMIHILVVDDDKNTRRLLRAVLEAEAYQVSEAENGEQALEALDREHVDLVVLDVMMPKMDGAAGTTCRS